MGRSKATATATDRQPMPARLWPTCHGCNRHEWNDMLASNSNKCSRCFRPVKIYKPKSAVNDAGPGGKGGSGRSGGAAGGNLLQLAVAPPPVDILTQALGVTSDPLLKAALTSAVQQQAKPAAPPQTAEEAVRRAASAWKDANYKHDQAVQQVSRCREALLRAEAKESETVRVLAEAEIARKLAAQALAAQAGFTAVPAGEANGQQAK
eukprot:9468117-Pyramimonas_sp.AAC.1